MRNVFTQCIYSHISFLRKLKNTHEHTHMQTMIEMRKTGMPPSMMSQFEEHAPQASVHWKWSEGSTQDI